MIRRTVLTGLAAAAATPVLAQTATPGVVRVTITTGEGPLVLDLLADKAPLTVANFLKYVDAGRYNGGEIYRGMAVSTNPLMGLVQGGAKPGKPIPPVAHEPTTQTGLKHVDGTVSLARYAPGTGTSDFFICVGDAGYLDANPAATGDNAGFAAFGQVVEGMDIVKRILVMPKSQKADNPAMVGQMLATYVKILSVKRA
ncbi:peptidylprolyl isomerase [Caulobacter sp. NIBR1757]|uniref:peptidylprolyl isomerase n=1 Tax=Caulobacter sp. NIBR1757 TaxID=3016000 RepID=UPI0022EFEEB9|nr:peptidylprolyl isomerase [Caulobacter sp. NIBR1757]WGM37429.1 Peptidyl-prolyl cis-trans isomerase A [Caulobacter sp. NIBR1757]